ncbi:MAG TPA: hypothetical protein VH394_14130 [Thermoanaerobaculia bacterium]|jgi:hypothetical protein|nr:hypothetical protein [Thermoanaerobaculia bacterium]
MTRTWKIAILLAAVPTLAWSFQSPHSQSPHAMPTGPDATEGESPFDGHYERTGAKDAADAVKPTLDILQVGPGVLRIKGVAGQGQISGTVKPERLTARFENMTGCKLDILFSAEGLKVQNTTKACGSLYDGEYKRTGPPTLGRAGGR